MISNITQSVANKLMPCSMAQLQCIKSVSLAAAARLQVGLCLQKPIIAGHMPHKFC